MPLRAGLGTSVTQAIVVDDGSRERVEPLIPVTTGGFAIPDTGGWTTGGR
jgi:hypothetical protein